MEGVANKRRMVAINGGLGWGGGGGGGGGEKINRHTIFYLRRSAHL